MSFLDKAVSDLSLSELSRLIAREVSRQVPPLPAGVAALADGDAPLVPPDSANQGQALVYNAGKDTYVASDQVISAVTAATATLADAATIAHNVDDGIITTAKIVDNAINAAKLGDNSVDTAAIVDSAVQTAKLNDLSVTTGKIALLAVQTAQIDALAVSTAKIADVAITNAKIGNLAVDTAQIAGAAITTAKIGDLQVSTGKIALLAVDTAQINDLAVATGKIANLAVGTAQIASAAITDAKINDLSAVKITAGDIDSARMNTNFLTSAIASISTLSAITVNMGTLTAGTIDATATVNAGAMKTGTLNAALITVNNLSATSITTGTLTIGGITWSGDLPTLNMQTNALAAVQVLATSLQAITASIGALSGGSITGSTLQTAAAGSQRVVMDSKGLRLEASDGTSLVNLPTDSGLTNSFNGKITTNSLTVLGSMVIQGTTNTLDGGAVLTLTAQVQAPTSPPTLAFAYETHVITNSSGQDTLLITYRSGCHYNTAGGAGHATAVFASTYLNGSDNLYYIEEVTASNYQRNRTKQLSETTNGAYDVVYVSGESAYYVIFNNATVIKVIRYPNDLSTTGTVCTFAGTNPLVGLNISGTGGVGMYYDGTNIVIVTAKTGDTTAISRRQFTVSGTTLTATGTAVNSSATGAITAGVMHGAHLAGTEFWVTADNINYRFNNATSTTTPVVQEAWTYTTASIDPDNSTGLRGVAYDGTNVFALSQVRIITKLTGFTWAATTNPLYLGYTWKDASHETSLNAASYASISLTNKQRGTLTITIPQAPTGVTGFNVYGLFNATAPANSATFLQTTSTTTASTSAAVSATMTAYASSGTAGRTTNNFAANTSSIAATSGGFKVDGSGTLQIPQVALSALPSGAAGQVYELTDSEHQLMWHDGSYFRPADVPEGDLFALRRALYRASGAAMPTRAQNFDVGLSNGAVVSGLGSGATRYYAVYWPGGLCTGMTFLVTTAGSYTDANARSGVALYSTDGTNLTRVAAKTVLINNAVGVRRIAWTSAPTLAAGIYYVAIRYVQSAVVTAPAWGGYAPGAAVDPSVYSADANNTVTPSNWSLVFTQTDATQVLATPQAISGLSTGAASLGWAGLY